MSQDDKTICLNHLHEKWTFWQEFKVKYDLDTSKVVLMLANDNGKIDEYAVLYLKLVMRRKQTEYADIFYCDSETEKMLTRILGTEQNEKIRTIKIDKNDRKRIYTLYCFMNFYDNMIFTYTDEPLDNLLGKVMRENHITEQEAVCLALYKLREVPELEINYV